MVATAQLNLILSTCGYVPLTSSVDSIIVRHVNGMTICANEAAMFLAHLIHESDGFQRRSEQSSEINKGSGGRYYGRGYLMLTQDYNYRAASLAIFGDERLLENPDIVSDSEDMSMRVSVWFWQNYVRPAGGPSKNNFGLTTKMIACPLKPPCNEGVRKMYNYYLVAARTLGVRNLAVEQRNWNEERSPEK